MKTLAVGVWAIAVSLGTAFAVAKFEAPPGPKAAIVKPALQLDKTRTINVPMIANGAVQGFIVAQFGYAVDKTKAITVSPEPFILDEAFRIIYTDDHLDFHHLDRYDIAGLTGRIVKAVNKKLGADAVTDVLLQDFSFVSKEDSQR